MPTKTRRINVREQWKKEGRLKTDMSTATMPDPMARPAKKRPSKRTFKGRVANNMFARRIQRGFSVKQAAYAITDAGYEVSASLIYQIERGVMFPAFSGLPAIATAYRCEVHDIVPNK